MSVDFLQALHPNGPYHVAEFDTKGDRKRYVTCNELGEAGKRIASANEMKWNTYIHICELRPEVKDRRANGKQGDVVASEWLWCDVDIPSGADSEQIGLAKQTILARRQSCGLPEPTLIVDSGHGLWFFWKIERTTDLDTVEQVNKAIQMAIGSEKYVFEADSCGDQARICRIGGSTNWPTAKKVAAGRIDQPLPGSFEHFPAHTYTLADFPQGVLKTNGVDADVSVGDKVKRLASIDDLDEWGVPDSLKVIAVQGLIPDEPKEGDNSRSAWVFHLACGLVRYDVPDDVIYSVLTDQGFKISESINENTNPHKYAVKQIKSAKEAAISEWLAKLNNEYAVIGNLGGKCRVIQEIYDHFLKRDVLVKQTFEDFRNRYCNFKESVIENKPNGDPVTRMIPVGKFWLDHPMRRQYDRLIFFPGGHIDGCYNLWQGFTVTAIKGDGHESFLDHIKTIICASNEVHYKYLMQWLALMVRKPAQPGEIAFVMRGDPGTGKGFFVQNLGHLFGRHFLHAVSTGQITGNFNNHMRDVVIVFADEALCTGDKKAEAALKGLITEPTIQIESKGIDTETAPNFTHLFMASNSDWVVPVGSKDRRYFIVDVDGSREKDEAYFGGIKRDLDAGGHSNLLYHLMHEIDLTGFSTQRIPSSEGRTSQQIESLTNVQRCAYDLLIEGVVPNNMKVDADGAFFVSAWLWNDGSITTTAITKELKKMVADGGAKNTKEYIGNVQKRGVRVPALPEARRYWARAHGFEEADLEWDIGENDSWVQDQDPGPKEP